MPIKGIKPFARERILMSIIELALLLLRNDTAHASKTVNRHPSIEAAKKYKSSIPPIPLASPISKAVAPDTVSINNATAVIYSNGLTDASINARREPPFLSSRTRLFTVSIGDEPTNIGVSVETIINFSLSSPEIENIIAING